MSAYHSGDERYRMTNDGDQDIIYDREDGRAWIASSLTVEVKR